MIKVFLTFLSLAAISCTTSYQPKCYTHSTIS